RRCEVSWLSSDFERLERDLAGKPGPILPDHAQKPGIRRARGAQKGSPAKPTGHTLLVAAQYSQKSPENNAVMAPWVADFSHRNRSGFSGRDPDRSGRPRAALPRSGS